MLFFLIKNYKIKHISSKSKIIYIFFCTALNLDKLTKKKHKRNFSINNDSYNDEFLALTLSSKV